MPRTVALADMRQSLPSITRDPQIHGGEPIIAGTRVPMLSVVLLFRSCGDPACVYEALPSLPVGGVEAALAFYEDHREEIDRRIDEIEQANTR